MVEELAIAYADGGSRGNPGPAGFGALLQKNGETLCTVNGALAYATNNVAEYTALVRILEKAVELGIRHIEVRMDSELVVKQMLGQYRVKNEGLIPLFERADNLSRKFVEFRIVHVRRELNKEADKLANQAMDEAARL